MSRTVGLGLTVAVLALLEAGLVWATRPPEAAPAAARVAQGLEVYRAQRCGMCHRLSAGGTKGTFGPPHDALGVVARARLHDPSYRGGATSAEAYVRESITHPGTYLVPGYGLSYHHMPAYTALSERELDALVDMLLQTSSPAGGAAEGGE